MIIILIGPPGAGKGTQAQKIAQSLNLPHIATGDIFREHLQKNTELGRKIREYYEKGELVPDELVIEVVKNRIAMPDCEKGFILDGFPRTIPQAEALDKILAEKGRKVDIVIEIDIPEEEATKRLLSRGRLDDKLCTIKRRFVEYHIKTQPIIDYYKKQGKLVKVDGVGSIEEVFNRIMSIINERISESE